MENQGKFKEGDRVRLKIVHFIYPVDGTYPEIPPGAVGTVRGVSEHSEAIYVDFDNFKTKTQGVFKFKLEKVEDVEKNVKTFKEGDRVILTEDFPVNAFEKIVIPKGTIGTVTDTMDTHQLIFIKFDGINDVRGTFVRRLAHYNESETQSQQPMKQVFEYKDLSVGMEIELNYEDLCLDTEADTSKSAKVIAVDPEDEQIEILYKALDHPGYEVVWIGPYDVISIKKDAPNGPVVTAEYDFVRKAHKQACSEWKKVLEEKFPEVFEEKTITKFFKDYPEKQIGGSVKSDVICKNKRVYVPLANLVGSAWTIMAFEWTVEFMKKAREKGINLSVDHTAYLSDGKGCITIVQTEF